MERYEEEYRVYWKVCLNAVGAPPSEVQLTNDTERIEREKEKDPQSATDPFWLVRKATERRAFLPVADHYDMLRLRGDKQYIRMHPRRWLWTMDALLAEYMYLVKHSAAIQTVRLPDEILDARAAYVKQRKKQRKELRIPVDRIKLIGRKGKATKCLLPKYTGSALLNLWCRDLCTHKRATSIKTDIRYDGEKFKLDIDDQSEDASAETEDAEGGKWDPVDFIPDYTLSDFIYHELATGLSLSIEITAALMELSPEIREFALEAFFEKCLSKVAGSKCIYTRIAVARSFFHQISLEWMKYSYSWDGANEMLTEEESKHPISPEVWKTFENSIDFACFYLGYLELGRSTVSLLGSELEIYPEDRVWVEHGRDQELLYQTDKKREERGEAVAPWIEVQNQEKADLYIHTRPFSFRKVPVPTDGAELERLIQYYEGLIGMAAYPLDLTRWKTVPTKNLAVFAQRKHTYVPVILDYLIYGSMKKWRTERGFRDREETPVIFKDSHTICIEFYNKVHSMVQNACIAALNA